MELELLTIFFFLIALIYSISGFGGGSSYIALLAIFNISYQSIPPLALVCNIIVVSTGSFRLVKNGHLSVQLLLPFIITSIPMAYLGGTFTIGKIHLLYILSGCLFIAGLRMILNLKKENNSVATIEKWKLWTYGPLIGGGLGFVSSLIGIGGGVFLAPILYLLRWGKPKQIAAVCSCFILINSIFGLIGHIHKQTELLFLKDYSWLFVAVFIGGQLGSYLTNVKLSQKTIKFATALLIFIASIRIFVKACGDI